MNSDNLQLFNDVTRLDSHPPIAKPDSCPFANNADRFAALSLLRFDYVRPDFACASQRKGGGRSSFGSTLVSEYPDQADWATQEYLSSYYDQDGEAEYTKRIESLKDCSVGSFGQALLLYYQKTQVPTPAQKSLFPKSYVAVHDVHHVLLGTDVTQQGELLTMAFECGLMTGSKQVFVLPLLAQLSVFLEPHNLNLFKPEQLKEAWNIGANATSSLLEDWDFWGEANDSLTTVRTRYNLFPLSNIWG